MSTTVKPLEKDIQKSICEYLEVKRYFFWRQNTAPMFQKDSGAYRSMPKFSMNGVPDIIMIRGGKFIGLEVKRPGNTMSDVQKTFKLQCEKNGGEYYVVTSIDDCIAIGL